MNTPDEQGSSSMRGTCSGDSSSHELAGHLVLVVEDDFFIAEEICTALRNSSVAITVLSFEPIRSSNGRRLEASFGTSFSLARRRRTRSSSASSERYAMNCSTCTASEHSMTREFTHSAGYGSTTRSEHTDHSASCRRASSRHVGSVNSLHLRLVSFEGYGQWAWQDYLALHALDPFGAIMQTSCMMFKFASCKFSRTCNCCRSGILRGV